jgi:hypothetical protein
MNLDSGKVFAYAIAGITFCAGMALVTGLLHFNVMPKVRLTFGAVLILMGTYRFLVTYLKPKPSKYRRQTNVDEE